MDSDVCIPPGGKVITDSNLVYRSNISASVMTTSGESNLTQGHIAAEHRQFSRIRQVAPMCTPYIESQKWLPWQHPLELQNQLCFHRIA